MSRCLKSLRHLLEAHGLPARELLPRRELGQEWGQVVQLGLHLSQVLLVARASCKGTEGRVGLAGAADTPQTALWRYDHRTGAPNPLCLEASEGSVLSP